MTGLYKPLTDSEWAALDDFGKRMEGQKWFDTRGKVHRMFINEYGVDAYMEWRKSRIPMSTWEKDFRRLHNLHPIDTAPVWDEYGKELY